ncbi:MAG TPA: metallophosphoesterase [Spirochaetia bacterium]|nr:metallophosphoesterase [Spirochaetia bacterium]
MRILFTSDLHALPEAFRGFAATLKAFDAGVIAGDLLDDYVGDEELARMFRLSPDDFLEELAEPEETLDDRLAAWKRSPAHTHMVRGLEQKEQEIKSVLRQAGRPVLAVRGNHDVTALATEGPFRNIHGERVEIDGVPFVGYGWVGRELDPERQMDGFGAVERMIDASTVLVTHCPPYQVAGEVGRSGIICSVGSRALAASLRRRRPRFHLFGHSHSSAGIHGSSINGAYPHVRHFFGIDTVTGQAWVEKDRTRPRPIWVQAAEDADGAEELIDLETLERNEMRAQRANDMRLHGTWYHDDGRLADGRRFIALGRHEYYAAFAARLSDELGTEVYLLDYMIWLDLERPHKSLLYFIEAAERIDINLQGISREDLHRATVGASRLAIDRRDLGLPYMTSWEINQVYWGGHLHKAWWHTGGSMSRQDVHDAMDGKASMERIVEGPAGLGPGGAG